MNTDIYLPYEMVRAHMCMIHTYNHHVHLHSYQYNHYHPCLTHHLKIFMFRCICIYTCSCILECLRTYI